MAGGPSHSDYTWVEASRDRNYEEELRDRVPLALASREQISGGSRITVEELTKLMT